MIIIIIIIKAIRTNVIKAKIDKTQEESKCRMSARVDETVNHILSECNGTDRVQETT